MAVYEFSNVVTCMENGVVLTILLNSFSVKLLQFILSVLIDGCQTVWKQCIITLWNEQLHRYSRHNI